MVKQHNIFYVVVVVVVVYCNGYIILLCYLYYFNILNAKIKLLWSINVGCFVK